MTILPKLTTKAACNVVGLNRDRFNEHVAAGHFNCAPRTVPGRARLFEPDDMLALMLFKRLMDDGFSPEKAGDMACAIAHAAKFSPDARAISYVESFFSGGTAVPASEVPPVADWDQVLFSGTDIRKVTTYRIGKLRDMIAHYTEEERSIIGEDD